MLFWLGIHYADKNQHEREVAWALEDQCKKCYDSICLSDMQLYYDRKPVPLFDHLRNWSSIFGHHLDTIDNNTKRLSKETSSFNTSGSLLIKYDSLYAISDIPLNDNIYWQVKFSKEQLVIESYQEVEPFLNRFKRSAIHDSPSLKGVRRRTVNSHFLTVFNSDTTSRIEKIQLQFGVTQITGLIIGYRK